MDHFCWALYNVVPCSHYCFYRHSLLWTVGSLLVLLDVVAATSQAVLLTVYLETALSEATDCVKILALLSKLTLRTTSRLLTMRSQRCLVLEAAVVGMAIDSFLKHCDWTFPLSFFLIVSSHIEWTFLNTRTHKPSLPFFFIPFLSLSHSCLFLCLVWLLMCHAMGVRLTVVLYLIMGGLSRSHFFCDIYARRCCDCFFLIDQFYCCLWSSAAPYCCSSLPLPFHFLFLTTMFLYLECVDWTYFFFHDSLWLLTWSVIVRVAFFLRVPHCLLMVDHCGFSLLFVFPFANWRLTFFFGWSYLHRAVKRYLHTLSE